MTASAKHRPQLDGLRAFAIGGVMYSHFWQDGSMFGHAGVRLFFVLSGYLITLMLIENLDGRGGTGKQPLWHFYVRRALRLWPAYMLLLGTATLFNWQNMRSAFWWHFFYGSNFLFAYINDWQPWTTSGWWSLAVEEQFYLVWPLVLLKAPRRFRVAAAVLFCVVGIGLRLLTPQDSVAFTTLPFSSFDALAGGALLAMADHARKLPGWFPVVTPLAMAAIYLSWGWSSWLVVHVDETLTVLMYAGIVALARSDYGGLPGWIFGNPILRYIGRISYGMYLYHLFVMAFLLEYGSRYFSMFQHRGAGLMLWGGLMTVAVASLSWHFVEAPMNRLKRRFPFP